jgi:uncharacterized phage protein (TIGR02218 family)
MKTLPASLQTHLDDGTTTLAWCWKISRADGEVLGFTDHDQTLTFAGTDFDPDSGFAASEIRGGADLSVDSQDAEGVLTSDRITEADILDGRWDNATVEVWRVNWNAPAQRVLIRRGAIGELRRGRMSFVAEVRSMAHVLGQTVGRAFQGTCDAALGDGRCGVTISNPAFSDTGSVTDVLRDRAFTASGINSFDRGWFAFGLLEWITGANSGRQAEVMLHDKASSIVTLSLLEAPVYGIAPGDGFSIQAGCDKRSSTCQTKFANIVNFRGFPHIPGQDTVIRYAKSDGGHDGAVL